MVSTRTVVQLGEHELAISHPDKMIWSEAGITKLKYVQLLAELAPFLLPYTAGRYLTTIRFPEGIHGVSFYQKTARSRSRTMYEPPRTAALTMSCWTPCERCSGWEACTVWNSTSPPTRSKTRCPIRGCSISILR